MFITFEGIEGCGKSTQCRMLKQWLEARGRSVLLTLEPGGSRLGRQLRSILLDMASQDLTGESELFLYLADRSQHVSQVITPALTRGEVVISDRYADSTVVYQGYGRGLDPKLLHQLNSVAVSGTWPDLTLLLDLPVATGLKRALKRDLNEGKNATEGRFEAESERFHNRVREGYLTWASLHLDRFAVIDAADDPETVFERVRQAVSEKLFPE